MKNMSKMVVIFILVGVVLVSGCQKELEERNIITLGQYHFFPSFNISCTVPLELVDEIDNISWEQSDPLIFYGKSCEAISTECTSERMLFKFNNYSLRHRIHFMGSPDDTYYLEYKNKRYSCK